MKNVLYAAMTVAAMTVGGAAQANLVGSNFGFTLFHDIPVLPQTFNDTHTYGTSQNYINNFGFFFDLDTTTPMVGVDNRIHVDLSGMQYNTINGDFDNTLTITGLAEDIVLSSLQVLSNGNDVGFNITSAAPNSFEVMWNKTTVLATGNPLTPSVDVIWNSVPTPGVLTLLGVAGLITRRRRRA